MLKKQKLGNPVPISNKVHYQTATLLIPKQKSHMVVQELTEPKETNVRKLSSPSPKTHSYRLGDLPEKSEMENRKLGVGGEIAED